MKPTEFLEEYYEKKKQDSQLPQQEKDINYWKNNCEEDYISTPISVLRYISELEKLVPQQETFLSKGSDDKSDFDKPFIDFAKQYVEQLKTKK